MRLKLFFSIFLLTIIFSIPAGAQWQREAGLEDIFIESLLVHENTLYAGADTVIYKKTGADGKWEKSIALPVDPGAGVYTMIKTGKRLFAGTLRHGVFETNDDGNKWVDRSAGLSKSFAVTSFTIRNGILYAGTSGNGIFALDLSSGSPEWIPFRNGLPDNTGAWDINTLHNHDGILVSGAGQSGYVYLNRTGSDQWYEKQFGEMVQVGLGMWALSNSNGSMVGAASNGLYSSSDSGSTWKYFNPGTGIIAPARFAGYKEKVYAALTKLTFGTFIFSTADGDGEWQFEENLPGIPTYDFTAFSDRLYSASYNGLWYRSMSPAGINDNITPADFVLYQNYPNPFNPSTTIKYSVPARSHVSLKVYDLLGREMTALVNEIKERGNHSVDFTANNISSGVYIYKLTDGKSAISKKFVVLK
jgi:photosystem II stability/assembly factor-like uncharacterized protein